ASGHLLAPYGGSSPRNRSSARVLEECINIRFGATFAPYIRHLAPFLILQVDRTGSLSPCLAAGKLQQHRNRILTPRGRWMCQSEICSAHLPDCCGAICTQASRAASASGKAPGLMGLGGDARVQSIPRAANRTYGAEGTR